MMDDSPFYKRAGFWLIVIPALFFLLFLAAFWREISLTIGYIGSFLKLLGATQFFYRWIDSNVRFFVSQQNAALLTEETRRAFTVLTGNCFFGLIVFVLMLGGMSQFVLPVQKKGERWRAFERLVLYLFRFHGPAIFVKGGKIESDIKEKEIKRPGVALLDLSSAIVLEKSLPVKGRFSSPYANDDEVEAENGTQKNFLGRKKKKPLQVEIKAFGPGLVFTEWGQKVHGAVDLRKQVRATIGVDAYTRDGIRVEATVFTVFSLSEEPETVYVAYIGDRKAENLRAVVVGKKDENPAEEVVGNLFKLNEADAKEIHDNFNSGKIHLQFNSVEKDGKVSRQQYPFHEDRVIQALYYLPHTVGSQNAVEWSALPNMVAVEVYRNIIAQYSYDYMHKPHDPVEFPLLDIKSEFAFRVKSNGLMKYQLVSRRDGYSITKNSIWNKDAMLFSQPPMLFKNHQALRDRGIKVIAASFGELKPPAEIRAGLLDNWKARWEKEIHGKLAQRDLESARIRNHARVQAQEESSFVLSDVFKDDHFSEEALTVRVFQALEAAATDVSEARLLPHDTISMLYSLYQWMLGDNQAPSQNDSSSPDDDLPGGGE
jgi:hypothetical protein